MGGVWVNLLENARKRIYRDELSQKVHHLSLCLLSYISLVQGVTIIVMNLFNFLKVCKYTMEHPTNKRLLREFRFYNIDGNVSVLQNWATPDPLYEEHSLKNLERITSIFFISQHEKYRFGSGEGF